MHEVAAWKSLLEARCASEKAAVVCPVDSRVSDQSRRMTYAQFAVKAEASGSYLIGCNVRRGDRILVIAESSAETCAAIYGSFLVGAAVVPVAPRTFGMKVDSWKRAIGEIALACDAGFVAGSERQLSALEPSGGIKTLDTSQMADSFKESVAFTDITSSDVALIQFTSGTTQRPRGVVLTHGNLLANICAIGDRVRIGPEDVVLCWLPLFHDMGLIGSTLFALYWGLPLVLMDPMTFAMKPESWLCAVSRFGITCCAAPNSAYDVCRSLERSSRLDALDLKRWRIALNGAEMVTATTIRGFVDRWASQGFSEHAVVPAYGLAENTVATSLPERGIPTKIDVVDRNELARGFAVPVSRDSLFAREIVSVGTALVGQELRVVSALPDRRPLQERRIGQVEVRGACVMSGYFRNEAATLAVVDNEGWLQTGDLGYLAGGQLYIVGRSKETIVCRGINYHASDVQSVVAEVEGIRNGIVAAFGISSLETGTEELVVVAETVIRDEEGKMKLKQEVANRLRERLQVRAERVLLVAPGTIPRTSSGKVRHSDARARILGAQT